MPFESTSLPTSASQAALQRRSHLRLWQWVVVLLSVGLTLVVWRYLDGRVREDNQALFEREAQHVIAIVTDRLHTYEEALRGGVSAIDMLGHPPSRDEWQAFADSLRLHEVAPGATGIGVIQYVPREQIANYLQLRRSEYPGYDIHPAVTRDYAYPIAHIEPVDRNWEAIGLDIAHESMRRTAANLSRNQQTSQATGPINLVQAERTMAGFLLFAPFQLPANDIATAIDGFVYAPFNVSELIDGALATEDRIIDFAVYDDGEMIYGIADRQSGPLSTSMVLPVYGREWRFDLSSAPTFPISANESSVPTMVLIGGLTLSGLLFALLLGLNRANRQAIVVAEDMTEAFRVSHSALSQSNEDLEKFAALAAHDLRTPLRGIASLTEYLEDDLHDYFEQTNARPDVARNLGRIRERIEKLDCYLRGLLDYSTSGSEQGEAHPFSVAKYAQELRHHLELTPEQLLVSAGEKPIMVDPHRLRSVISRLVCNAAEHHDGTCTPIIHISVETTDEHYRITIKDNGPGIPEPFRERAFKPFEVLTGHDDPTHVGVGLAIARRITESAGGRLILLPAQSRGCQFVIEWPSREQSGSSTNEKLVA
ncbi:MAG: CHASE domain-containing protein [Pseudomonadota bacterium]